MISTLQNLMDTFTEYRPLLRGPRVRTLVEKKSKSLVDFTRIRSFTKPIVLRFSGKIKSTGY